jgi:hypothetical protein
VGKVEQVISGIIEAEVERRVRAHIAAIEPKMIAPVTAIIPAWMTENGLLPRAGGDASKANGEFFKVLMDEPRKKLCILCPTFLRGPLSVSCERIGRMSY